MWMALGVFPGFRANLPVKDAGRIVWRLQIGSAFIPAVPLVLSTYFYPESPHWYIKKLRYNDAVKSLFRLHNSRPRAAKDLFYIHVQLEEKATPKGPVPPSGVRVVHCPSYSPRHSGCLYRNDSTTGVPLSRIPPYRNQ